MQRHPLTCKLVEHPGDDLHRCAPTLKDVGVRDGQQGAEPVHYCAPYVEAWTSKVLEFVVVVEERSPGPSEFALVHAIEDDRDHPLAQPRAGPKRPVGDPVTVLGSEMTVVQQTLPQPPASVTGELSEEQPVFGTHWAFA